MSDKVDWTTVNVTTPSGITLVTNNSVKLGNLCIVSVIVSGVSFAAGVVCTVGETPSTKSPIAVGAGSARFGSGYIGTSGSIVIDISGTTGGEIRLVGSFII